MTKENELYNGVMKAMGGSVSATSTMLLQALLDEFFSQNVCIPKGANRHPDADVLHTLVEDTSLRYEVQENTDIGFYNDDNFNQNLYEYRIKPSEPVYEYVWYFITKLGRLDCSKYLTKDEARFILDMDWKCDEETKRIRQ